MTVDIVLNNTALVASLLPKKSAGFENPISFNLDSPVVLSESSISFNVKVGWVF